MSEGMKPTRPERNIWHMEAGDARPDASSEPEPLIAPGSVVGLWVVEHLPVVHPHDHAFYEMALVLSGSGFHVCGDSEEPVQAGTVVFVPPGVAHGYRGCRDMEVYNCFFRAELAEFELPRRRFGSPVRTQRDPAAPGRPRRHGGGPGGLRAMRR